MINYDCFNSFIVRTPLLSLKMFYEKEGLLDNNNFLDYPKFLDALFLASPSLHKGLLDRDKFLNSEKDIQKLKDTFLKYFTRISTRCTPFGIFAGINIGKIGDFTACEINEVNPYQTKTRLDMQCLSSLVKEIERIKIIKQQLNYFPNSSIYHAGQKFRYVEYELIEIYRKYSITEVDRTNYLESLLEYSERGRTVGELIDFLLTYDVETNDAQEFIFDLIDCQLLVSELEPCVTGDTPLEYVIEIIGRLKDAEWILEILQGVDSNLKGIDSNFNISPISRYQKINDSLSKFIKINSDKCLIQSDLCVNMNSSSISHGLIESVKRGLSIINKFTTRKEEPLLKNFKEKFYERYEDEEIPLVEVLDPDIGIGFGEMDSTSGNDSPLLFGINFGYPMQKDIRTNISPIQLFLQSKYENFIKDDFLDEIVLSDEEMVSFEENWEDLPDTFSVMLEILDCCDEMHYPRVIMRQAGNTSAANILGRFGSVNGDINSFLTEIADTEKKINKNKILAELVHLPQSRTGNVILRPIIRDFEIPYLSNSSLKKENIIPISDILVSVRNGRKIVLRSQRLNKEVIPKLTTAHNFRVRSLPIYHFLGLVQHQDLRSAISFYWGPILDRKSFLPRVRYNNIILSPARWRITPNFITQISSTDNDHIVEEFLNFKQRNKIPDLVYLVEGDNKLLLNFNEPLSVKLFISSNKNKSALLEEFLYTEESSFVKKKGEPYTNEVLLGFYKKY